MNLFDRIRKRAEDAYRSVTGAIDRDKSMPGTQLARGGLTNRASNFVKDAYQNRPIAPENYQGSNLQQNIQGASRTINKANRALTQPEYGGTLKSAPMDAFKYISTAAPRHITGSGGKDNTTLQTVLTRPAAEIPMSIAQTLSGGRTPSQIETKNSPLASGLLGRDPVKSYQQQAETGGKDFLTDTLGVEEQAANKAVPFLAMAGVAADLTPPGMEDVGRKGLTKAAPYLDDIVTKLPRMAKGTMFADEAGNIIKTSRPPKTTASLDKILRQADEVVEGMKRGGDEALQATTRRVDDILSLPSGKPEGQKLLPEASEFTRKTQKAMEESGSGLDFIKRNLLEAHRFFKRAMPENLHSTFKQRVLDPLDESKSMAADFKNNYLKQIESLGPEFKKGSKYSELTQKFGEGVVTYDQLVDEVGESGARKVVEADEVFRTMYDTALEMVNNRRLQAGLDEIPKREDYYRHMSESSSGAQGFLESFFKGGPMGERSASIRKAREGDKTAYDAVGGFIDYIDRAARAGFTDINAREAKNFVREANLDPTLAKYIEDWSDNILGIRKGDLGDAEPAATVVESAANKIRGAKIIGNLSTVVSQGLSVPTAAWRMGPQNYISGLVNAGKHSDAMAKSKFLKDRGFKVPTKLFKGGERAVAEAGNILQEADLTASKSIWLGFYERGLKEGADDAVKYADDMAREVIGGRGLGDMAQWQRSRLGRLLTPFTVEVQAQAHTLGDMVNDKQIGGLIGLFVTNHVINNVYENQGPGFRPMPDPIETAVDAYASMTGADGKEKSKLQTVGRIIAGMLEFHPIGQAMTANTYALTDAVTGGEMLPDSRDIFGQDDPTRFQVGNLYNPLAGATRPITGSTPIDAVLNTAMNFVPGGAQASKTARGARSAIQGYNESRAGNILHEVPDDPISTARMLAFGPWANSESKDFFNDDFNRGLTEEQSETFRNLPDSARSNFIDNTLTANREKTKARSQGESEDGFFERIFGGGDDFDWSEKPTTKEGKDAYSDMVNSAIEGGVVPPKDALSEGLFNGNTGSVKDLEKRNEVFNTLEKTLDNEFITDEQRQAILDAAGVDENTYSYFQLASLPDNVQTQRLVEGLNNMPQEEWMDFLISGRIKVAGREFVTPGMLTYLYENDYITKDEKKMLSNLIYDEINEELQFKKGYKGSGSGSGKSKTKIKIPQFKPIDSFMGKISQMPPKSITNELEAILQSSTAPRTGSSGIRKTPNFLLGDDA